LTIDGGACHRLVFPADLLAEMRLRVVATWSDSSADPSHLAPRLGEQSREILSEAGFTADEIAKLVTDGVARVAPSIPQQQG
jgi:crotonobetainyl-CoA:carnitine CoA-transferase CaiB-like acyl-CoA transferase